ncbi:MAG: deoxynucleoside kinase [Bacteroidetes bacterium]|nr:deoxynucleoside kinase [Bacteroidota bacterium]
MKKTTDKKPAGIDFKHIAIAGNIGAGKTTLVTLLAKHYGWTPHFEEVENNPYIDDFYQDMQRWSFHMQIYYLNNRFQQILDIRAGEKSVIQDRTIYEDAHIFAPNLHDMSLMSTRDYEAYQNLYKTLQSLIAPPDLLIYLRASIPTLVTQIQKRGRSFEDSIRLDYLKKLNARYEEFIEGYDKANRLLVINVDDCNFEEDPAQLGDIINRIERERGGLF